MGLLQFQLLMARRKYQSPISSIAAVKQKTDSAVMFPFLSLVVIIPECTPHPVWVIEAFYQVFTGILPQAAERYRAANKTLHKWQKAEAEGFVLGVFGGGTKEEKGSGLACSSMPCSGVGCCPRSQKRDLGHCLASSTKSKANTWSSYTPLVLQRLPGVL